MSSDMKDTDELINAFIEKWLPKWYPHLVDSDENDGERLRQSVGAIIKRETDKARVDELEQIAKIPFLAMSTTLLRHVHGHLDELKQQQGEGR